MVFEIALFQFLRISYSLKASAAAWQALWVWEAMIFLPFLIASPQATAPEDENLWNVLLLNSAEYNLRQVEVPDFQPINMLRIYHVL